MLTDEHEHAMKVWREADRAGEDAYVEAVETGTTAVEAHEAGNRAAAAVIAADRAGLVAENARLAQAWEAQHKEKVKERDEARLWFERAQKWAEEIERLLGVVDALLQHDASSFWGVDAEKNRRASYRGVVRKAKKARAALKDTRHEHG